jgi:hypothetical protein
MAGFSQGGGVGLALAQWILNGDPGFDVWAMDVARFGDWASKAYTNAKVRENYSRRFSIRFPNEELPAGRPLRTSPIYDRLRSRGAQFGAAAGLEVPLWLAPEGVRDEFSWHRSTDFDTVGEEVRAARCSVVRRLFVVRRADARAVIGAAAIFIAAIVVGAVDEAGGGGGAARHAAVAAAIAGALAAAGASGWHAAAARAGRCR